jgi:hypothetical protein
VKLSDTENHFRALAATGDVSQALAILDRLDAEGRVRAKRRPASADFCSVLWSAETAVGLILTSLAHFPRLMFDLLFSRWLLTMAS